MRTALLSMVLAPSIVMSAFAQGLTEHYQLNIQRQSLDAALTEFERQTGLRVARFNDTVDGSAMVGPLTGDYSAAQALSELLTPVGFTYEMVSEKAVAVIPAAKRPDSGDAKKNDVVAMTSTSPKRASVDRPAPDPSDLLEEVVVTGSNIKRTDAAVLPMTVLDNAVLDARNVSTPSALLNSLPQVTSAPLNESANASFAARGDFAAVNLRGIGTGNTLILLNGRRLVPHPISSTDEGGLPSASVNVNQLPSRGVQHIEMLRDGASSIYGTDAVAGVVNYLIDKDFRGVTAIGRATSNEHGDGQEWEGALKWGMDFAGGKGHIVSVFDYYNREAIFLRDRSFSADGDHTADAPAPWDAPSTFIPLSANRFYGRQSTGTYPSFRIGSATATTFLSPQPNGSVSVTTATPVRGGGNDYYFSLNQFQAIQPSSERVNWFNQVEYEIQPGLTAFGELSYYHADSTIIRQPVAYNSSNFTDQAIVVPASSPWNPFGQPVTLLTKYLTDIGPERDDISDTSYRILAGLRGEFGGGWSWESAAYYNQAKVTDTAHNAVRESLFRQAIQSGAYNPFGFTFNNQGGVITVAQPYLNPASASAGFIADFQRNGETSLTSVDFRTTGKLLDMWAGAISAAVGGEVRKETFKFDMPAYAGLNPAGSGLATDDNDFLLSGPAANWAADRTVTSAYAETVVPLAAPGNAIPLLRSLELTASVRYEDYDDFGSTTKPKVGISWRPLSWVMLRASYNEGFRAPNLPALNGGERKNLQSFLDPVFNVTGPHWGIFAGNAALKPEESRGKSAGLVIDVPKLDGLTLSADYWEITQRNLITTTAINDVMLSDAALLAPIIAANPTVPVSQQNFGSGTDNYRGDPRVIRNAADNTVYGVRTPPFNSAKAFISGVDLSLSYQLPEFALGQFVLRSDWAYLGDYYMYSAPGALKDNRLERDGAAKWRGNLALSWSRQDWSAGVSAYYIGPYQDSAQVLPAATAAQRAQSEALYQALGRPSYIARVYNLGQVAYRYVVPSTTTYNAFVGYAFSPGQGEWLQNASLKLGVVNLTDVEPPLDGGFTGYPTNVYTSLVPGRTWTLDFSLNF